MKDQYSGHVNGLQSSIQIMYAMLCNFYMYLCKKKPSATLIFECRMASSHYLIGLKFKNCMIMYS